MTTLLVPIGAIIYLKLNKFYQFLILALASLLPLSFGSFRSVPSFQFIEWIPFVTLLVLVHELIPVNRIEKTRVKINFKGGGIFIFAILILTIWALVSLFENQLLIQNVNYVQTTGTTRIYFKIFNNILLFFVTIVFVTVYFEEINFELFFKFLLNLAIVLGLLRLASHFFDFNIPFLSGEFTYGGEYGKYSKILYGGTAYRLGGLTDVVSFGLPALFSYFIYKQKMNLILFLILLLFLFLSGGRTVMIGSFIAVVVFSFLFFPKNFIYLTIVGGLFLIIGFILLPESVLQGQLGRFTTYNTETSLGVDAGRALGWNVLWQSFLANPIWGKGIGINQDLLYLGGEKFADFAREISFAGGHGSYLSALGIFGIGGIIYFLTMLFGGIILSFRKINQYVDIDIDKTAIAVFTFLLLIIKSFDLLTAKNGLDVPVLFFIVGLIVSLSVHHNWESSK